MQLGLDTDDNNSIMRNMIQEQPQNEELVTPSDDFRGDEYWNGFIDALWAESYEAKEIREKLVSQGVSEAKLQDLGFDPREEENG